jgi:hypothetical protein
MLLAPPFVNLPEDDKELKTCFGWCTNGDEPCVTKLAIRAEPIAAAAVERVVAAAPVMVLMIPLKGQQNAKGSI